MDLISSRFSSYTSQEHPVVSRIISKIGEEILNPLIVLAFAVAGVIFIWGVFQFIRSGDDPSARAEGAKHILWGLLGFVIMMSAYGIIYIILNTFDIPIPNSLN
jgi:hypothetical protein